MMKGRLEALAKSWRTWASLPLNSSSAVREYLLTETHQALKETFTVVFEILMKLRERVPVLDGDVVV